MAESRSDAVRWLPAAILVAIPACLVLTAVGPGRTLYGSDVVNLFYYNRAFVGDQLAEGRLPVWDPHTACGFPLLAAMQSAVFYPLTWPAAFLPPGTFWAGTALVHLILAGGFAFAWLRRGLSLDRWSALAGALVFMLSGYLVTNVYAGHVPHISAYPWLAAILWRLERLLTRATIRRWVLLAVAVPMPVLAGFPHFALFACLLVAARLGAHLAQGRARWRTSLAVSGAVAAGLLLAAPQILPTLELIPQAQRAGVSTYDFATSYSMPPENLVTLVAPTAFGDEANVPYWGREYLWEVMAFVGISALALAAIALAGRHRRRWLWGGIAAASLLLALGRYAPFFRAFYAIVPGADFFRVPGRFLALFALAMSALAALGVERLRSGETVRAGRWAAAGAFALCLALMFAGIVWAAICAGALAAVLATHAMGRLSGRGAAAAVSGLLGLELLCFGGRYFQPQEEASLPWPGEFVTAVKNYPAQPLRIASDGPSAIRDAGRSQMAGLDHVGGYDALLLRRYTELMNVVHGRPADALIVGSAPNRAHPALDMLGVRFRVVGSSRVHEAPSALPRAFVVGRARVIESPEERLRVLADASFDPRAEVILEAPVDAAAGGGGMASVQRREAGLYELEAEGPGFLVLAEAWYPGWEARIDGQAAPVLRANHLVQAVRLGPGRHRVRFAYASRPLRWGFALFGLAVLVLVGAAVWGRVRRRGLPPAPQDEAPAEDRIHH